VATDKLAILIALIHRCVEYQADDPTAPRDVQSLTWRTASSDCIEPQALPFVDTHGPNSEGANERYELQPVKGGHAAMLDESRRCEGKTLAGAVWWAR
jgi:hypothetical protein